MVFAGRRALVGRWSTVLGLFVVLNVLQGFAAGPRTSIPMADLAVVKGEPILGGLPHVAPLGQPFKYAIGIQNRGPGAAANIMLLDTPSTTVTFLTPIPTGCTLDLSGSVSCTLGSLPAQEMAVFEFTAIASTPGVIPNRVFVSSFTSDPNPGNNSDQIFTTVQALTTTGGADLSVATRITPDAPLTVPRESTIELVVTNNGPFPAVNPRLVDRLMVVPGSAIEVKALRLVPGPGSCSFSSSRSPFAALTPPFTTMDDVNIMCMFGSTLPVGGAVNVQLDIEAGDSHPGFGNGAAIYSRTTADADIANNSDLAILPRYRIRGDTNDDGLVDLSDVALIQECFRSGPPSPPCDKADVNGDGNIDNRDLAQTTQNLTAPPVISSTTPTVEAHRNPQMGTFGLNFGLVATLFTSKQDFIDQYGELDLPVQTHPNGHTSVSGGGNKTFTDIPDGHYVGTTGAEGCIGLLLNLPDGQTMVFHFTATDNPFKTLTDAGPFPAGTQAAICGGNNEDMSNVTLFYVSSFLSHNPQINVQGYSDTIGIWTDNQGNLSRLPSDQASRNK